MIIGNIMIISNNLKKGLKMFTAIIKKSGPWWIGWIEEIPGVNCQEKTKEELLLSLKSALKEALEIYRGEAIKEAGNGYETELIAI